MSTRLHNALDQLLEAAEALPELQEWVVEPLDGDMLDEIERRAHPWRYPDEILHMARRTSFLPGLYGWSLWPRFEGSPVLPGPVPGQLFWEKYTREIDPEREPVVRWAMLGDDPEGQEDCVVPLLQQRRDHAPICFTDGISSLAVASPSLAAFLESFLVCLDAFTNAVDGDPVRFPDSDRYFDFSWWETIHRPCVEDRVQAVISGPLERLNAADQSDHPTWALRGQEVDLLDRRLLWPDGSEGE